MLGQREWLAGGYSYADIAFYMAQLFGERMGAPLTQAHPRLTPGGSAWERVRPCAASPAPWGATCCHRAARCRGFLARLSG